MGNPETIPPRSEPLNPNTHNFHTTRWTMVLQARGQAPEARAALSDLCQAYYHPVHRFLLREGKTTDEADELTQGFFTRILSTDSLRKIDPAKGRFRSYLLGALKHFLGERRRHQSRLKRGGDKPHQSLDEPEGPDGSGLSLPDPGSQVPDAYFDREWALALMDRSLKRVEESFARKERSRHFDILKPWLMGEADSLSQAGAATALNLTPGAVKVAIHRLRKDFAEAIRAEIAQTVQTPAEIADELRYLIEALSSARAEEPS